MSCLNAGPLDRLATKIELSELATLKDPRDKLSSKLYQRKVAALVSTDCVEVNKDD